MRITHPTALVLVALSRGVRYGFDIIDATGLQSGTVYPVLRRLEEGGLLTSRWEPVREAREAQRPPRRYYQLTGGGAEAVKGALQRYPAIAQLLARPAGHPRPA